VTGIVLFWFMERFKTLTRDEVWKMLNLLTAIEETSGYQAIKAEGWKAGREEGLQTGREEGLQTGREEGLQTGLQTGREEGEADGLRQGIAYAKADDLARLLTRRFGPLPDWAAARIAAAPVPQLDAWLDGIFDAPGLRDLIGPEDAPSA